MQQDLNPGLGLMRGVPRSGQIKIHGPDAFEGMRRAGALAAATLDFITPYVRPGITTGELDLLCHSFIVDHDAIPAPLNYRGFPKSICTSVNHVVCHGIPGDRRLAEGDILNIDVTVIVDGWHGDTSRMFLIGDKIPVKARSFARSARPSRNSRRASASRWCAISAGTASARSSMTPPPCSITTTAA